VVEDCGKGCGHLHTGQPRSEPEVRPPTVGREDVRLTDGIHAREEGKLAGEGALYVPTDRIGLVRRWGSGSRGG